MKDPRNIVVTGMGAVSPAGLGCQALWGDSRSGRSHGQRIRDFDTSGNRSKVGARIKGAIAARAGNPDELQRTHDPVAVYALEAVAEALDQAGLSTRDEIHNLAVCVGTAVGGVMTMERSFRKAVDFEGKERPQKGISIRVNDLRDDLFTGFYAPMINQAIIDHYRLQAFSLCPATGCTAGIDSIGAACDLIAAGVADVAIAGASEAPFTPIVFTAFDNVSALSTREAEPTSVSCPFDRRRDGFLLSEGAGILVIEEETHARKRGVRILGRVLGYSSNSNAFHMTALAPHGSVQSRCVLAAAQRSRINLDEIDYFNAHGTSTPQNDLSETSALKTALGRRAFEIPVSSTKSVFGHALGAASAIASVVVINAIQDSLLPPTANYIERDDECDLDFVPNQAREGGIRVAGVNASGFSGIHSTIFYASESFTPRSG